MDKIDCTITVGERIIDWIWPKKKMCYYLFVCSEAIKTSELETCLTGILSPPVSVPWIVSQNQTFIWNSLGAKWNQFDGVLITTQLACQSSNLARSLTSAHSLSSQDVTRSMNSVTRKNRQMSIKVAQNWLH